jgi:hypothetical protein
MDANNTCLDLCLWLQMQMNSFLEGRLNTKPWKGVRKLSSLFKYAHL